MAEIPKYGVVFCEDDDCYTCVIECSTISYILFDAETDTYYLYISTDGGVTWTSLEIV